ncbi:transporter substrate-binding domain-containing protein [Brevibacillus massiliensis]|uniref:transporter substrate-binding domain-containing protein n=1 Tax=Brevibacillus massiliensis TaxID=1118054 RepID=UPI0002DFFF56|nr:transporter substrate-binding domain-containing protein [Brevibacillus massiliensis]
MKRFSKQFASMLLLAMLCSLVLAGCGGASNKTQSTGGQTEQAADDAVLKKIKETKTLTVGTDATFQPFEFKNDKKEFDGFDIDLIRAVAKELGADNVEFVDTEFKGLIPGLQAKKFDLIASAMYITDERKLSIAFSDSYYPGGLAIMVKKDDNSIKGIEDLKGKKAAVQIGTKSVKFLEDNYPDVTRVEVEKNVEMFLELESGRVDAVVTGMPAAKVYAKQSGKVKVLEEPLTQEEYGYGIRKQDTAFVQAVNEAIQAVKDSGEYQKIVEKWFGN